MNNRLEIFILFLKDNELYYRFMKNAKRHYKIINVFHQKTKFLKYIECSAMNSFCWSKTEEGVEFWCDASIMWRDFLTNEHYEY